MTTPLGYATLGLYGTSLAFYGCYLYAAKRMFGWAATVSLAAGIGVHWQALLERSRLLNSVPYQDLVGSMSLFAWLLAVTYLGLESYHRQRSVGPFVLPVVMALMVTATLLASGEPAGPPPSQGTMFAFHVTLNILGYSAFTLSFVMSVIYLLQNRVLRDRRLGSTFWRFPPLDLLERMSRTSAVVGVVALAAGIALGLVKAERLWEGAWLLDPKVISSFLTLALYAAYLWLGRTTAWRGARASLLCVVNFLFLIFSYTVVNIYLSEHHRYF
jgi:ABC-type transport system involved in cytochrome c biogenesis permease subunit